MLICGGQQLRHGEEVEVVVVEVEGVEEVEEGGGELLDRGGEVRVMGIIETSS